MLLALLAVAAGCAQKTTERVVLVSIDTLRADHVGSYGARRPTPTMDAVAAAGVRFAEAISPAPLTLPSHTSLLTGLNPPHHGVRNNSTFRLSEDVPTLAERMRAAGFATAAFVGSVVLDRQFGLARGFDVYDDEMTPRLAAGDTGFAERTADRVADAALAWLATAPERFFLWVHFYDPHADYHPPQRFLRVYRDAPYDGEIAFVDMQLGRLLDAIDERFGAGGTLVVVTSDHGESLGEHGEYTHSLSIYDATQHVPLLMRGPGLPRGRVVQPAVRLIDVVPTILAQVGAPALAGIDGADLGPLVRGEPEGERTAYMETLSTQLDHGWSPLLGVRTAEFKYIRAPRPELFDLIRDPRETHNVFAERGDVAAEMDRRLEGALAGGRPVVPTLRPDAEARRLLESLGYVVSEPSAEPRFGLGRVGGIDPKDGMATVPVFIEARAEALAGHGSDALAKIEAANPKGFFQAMIASEVARAAGDARAAERYARQAVSSEPGFSEAHEMVGRALEAAGRWDAADAAYRTAAGLDAAAAPPIVGLGRVAEARGDRARAATLYADAMQRRSRSAEATWRLAALRLEDGDAEAADHLLGSLEPAQLATPEAVIRVARAEARAGRVPAARARLTAALETRPERADLRAALAAPPAPTETGDSQAAVLVRPSGKTSK